MANSLSLVELFAEIETLTGTKADFERIPVRASDQRVFVADVSKAKRAFGWEPRVGRREGLRRMLEWVKSARGSTGGQHE